MTMEEAHKWLFDAGWCSTNLHLSDSGGFCWARTEYNMNGSRISCSLRTHKHITEHSLKDLAGRVSKWLEAEQSE